MNKSKTTLLLQDHYNIINSDDTITDFIKRKTIMLCAILYNRQYNFKSYKGYPTEMIAKHLKLNNGDAISILNYLIDKNIITRGNSYNTGANGKNPIAKDIMLNTNSLLYSTETISFKYEYKTYKKKRIQETDVMNIEDQVSNILDELTIDYNKLEEAMINEEYDLKYRTYLIKALKEKCHNISVSTKCNRLYSIATQMSGDILKAGGKLDGESLMSIDFSNMHPAIFANMLNNKINTEDFKIFYKHATEGTFYNYLTTEINKLLKAGDKFTEKEVKLTVWMVAIYGEVSSVYKPSNKISIFLENDYLQMIENVFPSFVNWLKEYKVKHKTDNISVSIQSKESKLMLDNIVSVLYSKGFKVIPRHDEVLVKQSEYNTIKNIIKGILNELDLKINIKNEIKVKDKPVFKVVKLEDEMAYLNAKEQEIVLFGGGFEEAFREEKQKIKQQDEDDKFYNYYKKKKEPLMVLEY